MKNDISPNGGSSENNEIVFPPKETVVLTDEKIKELLSEGMKFRKEVEKSTKRMFVITNDTRWD